MKNETLGRTKNIIYTFQSPAREEDIQEAFSADGTTVFKKSFSIELVKESAGTEENDNDSLSLAISLFVSFMMQLTWLFIVVGFFGIVIMDFIYFVQPS